MRIPPRIWDSLPENTRFTFAYDGSGRGCAFTPDGMHVQYGPGTFSGVLTVPQIRTRQAALIGTMGSIFGYGISKEKGALVGVLVGAFLGWHGFGIH